VAAADQAAKVAIQVAKGGAVIVGGWLLKKFGDKAAEEGFEKGKEAASKRSGDRRQRMLAQDMARAHGWKYTERHVIADEHRYVVWNDEKLAMAAFPKVNGAESPEALRERFELKNYTPSDDDLITPPPKK
jgi:hypothetical protein